MGKYISISVTYVGPGGSKILQRGEIPVNYSNFAQDEQKEIVRVAKGFINTIRKEMGSIEVIKVISNNRDITNLCN